MLPASPFRTFRQAIGSVTVSTHQAIRTTMLLLTGAWAWFLVCVGPNLILHNAQVGDVSSRWSKVECAASVAAGIFVFLVAARRCFPLASPKVKLACEITPWIGLGGFVIGGLV
jgi:hypothetical protein